MFPVSSTPQDLTNNVPLLGLGSELESLNPVLLPLQLATETDKIYCNGQNRQKIGDGKTEYSLLPYTNWEQLYDFGSITNPDINTPIDAGTITSPAINFMLDFCIF